MFFRVRTRPVLHLIPAFAASGVLALVLTLCPARADVSTDVTLYDALSKLAYTAKENDSLAKRDNLDSLPFAKPAYQLLQRVRQQKTGAILWGFGNEMASAVGKVLAQGGAKTTAEIIGLVKDAANSRSFADFLVKAGPKKAWTKVKDHFKARGEPDANAENLANKSLDRLFKRLQLANRSKRIVSAKSTGLCKGGVEEFTIDLDLARGDVVMELNAKGCTCSRKTDLKAYSGKVVGKFNPASVTNTKKLKWFFTYRGSTFSGLPCNPKDKAIADGWRKHRQNGGAKPPPGAEKPRQCTASTCTFLVRRIDLEERMIQALACRMGGLKRQKRDQSDEYKTAAEDRYGLSTSLTGAFAEYVACKCDRVSGVPADVFRLRGFLDALKRSIRPPYTPPKLPVSDKAYCPKCDPYRSWIGEWSMWGKVDISMRNGALHFDWTTTYASANPIKTKVLQANAAYLRIAYEMNGGVERGELELILAPDGRRFTGIRKAAGSAPKSRGGDRIGEPQKCGK